MDNNEYVSDEINKGYFRYTYYATKKNSNSMLPLEQFRLSYLCDDNRDFFVSYSNRSAQDLFMYFGRHFIFSDKYSEEPHTFYTLRQYKMKSDQVLELFNNLFIITEGKNYG
jgi:hypothetical protein